MRAIIYCRVSSAGQEENSSLGTQEERCRRFAVERGWAIANVFREVQTGSELFERPQLTRLREMVRAGEADIVLAFALDRVSRSQAHLGFLLSEWENLGVRLELVTEQLTDTPEGRLLQSVRGFVAEIERLKIAERTKRGSRARVLSGRPLPGQKAPLGYKWRDEDKTGYVIDPEGAALVRRIYDAVLSSKTLRSIAMALTAEGIPTSTGRGKRWEVSSLHSVLKNPVYTGRATAYRTKQERHKGKTRTIVTPPSEWIPLPGDVAPPIVSEDEFLAVQERLAQNRAAAPRNNADPEATLLRCGVARCGYCGYPLSITRRSGKAHMYRCHPVGRDRHGCPSFGVMAPILDGAVWERVKSVLNHPEIIEIEVARRAADEPFATDLAAVDRRLKTIGEQRARLARAIAAMDDEEASAPVLAELHRLADEAKSLGHERSSLEKRAAEGEADRRRLADLSAWCGRVAGNIERLDYRDKRMILEALGVSVAVYKADHDPRWEITMAPLPVEPSESSDIVFRTGTPFSTATPASTPRRSTGSRSCSAARARRRRPERTGRR